MASVVAILPLSMASIDDFAFIDVSMPCDSHASERLGRSSRDGHAYTESL